MTILSRIISRVLRLPPATTRAVTVTRDIAIPMRDGTVLLADHYVASNNRTAPTILVRSPYGRTGAFAMLLARPFAERGFQVLIQSCRGTFGSGGEFNAFRNEQSDGQDTLRWMEQQPWFGGAFATAGPSYLGQVQWALASSGGSLLRALSLQITSSEFRSLIYPGEAFGLDTALTWISQVAHQEDGLLSILLSQRRRAREMRIAAMHLPLRDADTIVTGGRPVRFYRDWLEHNAPDDPWWQPVDFSSTAGEIDAPIQLIGGWYDIFLPHTIADYARLRQAGKQPYLTIGPWAHTSTAALPVIVRESLDWFRTHLLGETGLLRSAPVRVFVMGSGRWLDLPDWPPQGYQPQPWLLQPGRRLSTRPAPASGPDRFRYDPADPTPSVGGSSLSQNSGPQDNRALEARADVLTYTSDVLDRDLEVIGALRAELFVTSSREHTDFFVRLCDVEPGGRSINVSDGLVRLQPGQTEIGTDGVWKITVELWATAHCFRRGHRMRVQVSGGAHPRYARNTGSGEPLGSATTLVAADHVVFHDPEHPSAIMLPVRW